MYAGRRMAALWLGLAVLTSGVAGNQEGCSFKAQQCTYHVQLSQVKSECNEEPKPLRARVPWQQDDVAQKVTSMEQNLITVKDDHEKRLNDLERLVRELLELDNVHKFGPEGSINSVEEAESRKERIETELMKKLHDEFSKLREEVKRKTSDLLFTQIKLNETEKLYEESAMNLFTAREQLLNSQNRVSILEAENEVLRKQLAEKLKELGRVESRLANCENKTLAQERENVQLAEESLGLRKSLAECNANLNVTSADLSKLRVEHHDIERKYVETKNILHVRERELITCYSSKTQTFCGFENSDVCGFTQENGTDDFDWTWVQGKTPSPNTGPTGDHTCQSLKGHFMYLETSARGQGKRAVTYSPLYRAMSSQCVEFYYHMWGRHVGTLNVYAKARGMELMSVWRAYGNQGDHWSNARLQIPKDLARSGYQIAFEGITANGYQGDISIDDVKVTDGPCPVDPGVLPVEISVNSTALEEASKNFARRFRRKNRRRGRGRGRKRGNANAKDSDDATTESPDDADEEAEGEEAEEEVEEAQ